MDASAVVHDDERSVYPRQSGAGYVLSERQVVIYDLIKKHEGFRGMPYEDSRGFPTIGYGTKLPIDEEEAELLLKHRLDKMTAELKKEITYFDDLPNEIQAVLLDMLYNLGVNGLLRFKRMWKAVEHRDWERMALEMQNSRWYNQVGRRAEELIAVVHSV